MKIFLGFLLACLVPTSLQAAQAKPIEMVTLEVGGTKFWLPSVIVVKKSKEKMVIHARVPGGGVHGLTIDGLKSKVEAVVDEKGVNIEFVPDKADIYTIRCHLHPAHIGGQLVVLD